VDRSQPHRSPSRNTVEQPSEFLTREHLIQCEAPEASALGAAYLAGLSLGLWSDLQIIAELPRNKQIIEPQPVDRSVLLDTWNDAIARSTA
ncbi:glycerol kinase, partial [Rhizobium ruizarguesonis]